MSILRNKFKDRFVQIPNALVSDVRISVHARLVYIYLRSKPDGWTVRNADVMNVIGVRNSSTMAKYWSELEALGWITRHKTAAGTYDYELNELEPIAKKPNVEKTAIVNKPYVGQTNTIYNTDSYINTEEFSNNNINIPYAPQKKDTSNKIKSELAQRINALFHRRESTAWSFYEMRKLNEVAKRTDALTEMGEIEKLYNSDYPYRRRDISTFLNQWTTELDRARNYKPQVSKFDRTTREVADYDCGF